MTTVYKNVEHKINWLDAVSGLTVTEAINYLISLGNGDLILEYSLDGDTQAVWLESNIIERVPMTKEERIIQVNEYYDNRAKSYSKSYDYAHKNNDMTRVASLDKIKYDLEDKRVNAISKINKEYEQC